MTDNRTNEPTEAQVRAAAHAVAKLRKEQTGAPAWFNLDHARAALEAAARAAQGAAPHRPVIDREKLIDVLVMTDLSDYAGTDMRAISQCADAILAHLAADTGGQRDA